MRKKKSNRQKLIDKAYGLWCDAIHARGKCELCGKSDGKLDAHHIEGRTGKLLYWLPNGILLCFQCHRLGAHAETYSKQEQFHEKLTQYLGVEKLDELKLIRNTVNKVNLVELEQIIDDLNFIKNP